MKNGLKALAFMSATIAITTAGSAFAQKEVKKEKAPVKRVIGQIMAVDQVAKTFTVKTKEGEATVGYDENTLFVCLKIGTLADLANDAGVAVTGEVSEDESSIVATMMRVLPEIPAKPRLSGKSALGILSKQGDKLELEVGDKTLAIEIGEKARIIIESKGSPTTLAKEAQVMAQGKEVEGAVVAVAVTVMPKPDPKAEKKAEAEKKVKPEGKVKPEEKVKREKKERPARKGKDKKEDAADE